MQINTENIAGFGDMTPEQKVEALLGFQFDDGAEKIKALEESNAKLKASFDKAASEVANYKKQLNANKSEEEQTRIANEEAMAALQAKVEEFEKLKRLADAKAAFLSNGFDDASATAAASAFIEGDIVKASDAVKQYRSALEQQIKSSLMDSNPKPDGGNQTDDGKAAELTIAEQLGKARAEQTKRAQSIINQYT